MDVIEAARGILGARRHAPDQPVHGVSPAHERFRPDELLEQAAAAERAGFDAIACSDHLAPAEDQGDRRARRGRRVPHVSGADPLGALRVYGEEILPELRG